MVLLMVSVDSFTLMFLGILMKSNGLGGILVFLVIGAVAAILVSGYKLLDWAQEGGDPCLPVPWSWLECNSDPQPKIISV